MHQYRCFQGISAASPPAKIAALVMCGGLVGVALTYIIAVAQGHRLGIFVVGCALCWNCFHQTCPCQLRLLSILRQ